MSNLERFKQVQQAYNEAVKEENAMQAELKLLKKQSVDILKSYGFTSFSDIGKLKERISELEAEMEQAIKDMENYITYVNKKKEEKDNILLG